MVQEVTIDWFLSLTKRQKYSLQLPLGDIVRWSVQERPVPGGMPEPALQAEESLMELAEGQETKRCAACRIVKPVSEYYKDRTHSRGIKTRCKQCLRLCKEAFKNQQRAKSAAEQVNLTSILALPQAS